MFLLHVAVKATGELVVLKVYGFWRGSFEGQLTGSGLNHVESR
jgi:hypothetical protein